MQPIARPLPDETDAPQIADTKRVKKDVAELNRLLRGEMAALDTYTQCIAKLEDGTTKQRLEGLRDSHRMRRDIIHNRVRLLGGTPDEHSGTWGAIASLFEGGASAFGEQAALRALAEGEMHGLRRYDRLGDVSSPTRTFVNTQLLPEQERTANALTALVDASG